MNDKDYKIFSPFGPSICKVKIPKNLQDELNKYVEEVIKNKKKTKELDHGKNLAGNVNQEIKLEENYMTKIGWDKFLARSVGNWINAYNGKKISSFKLVSSWIVRQFKNEYNPTHWHGGHISGVGYLKVPKKFGDTFQKSKTNFNGYLQLIHGSKMFLCNSTLEIKPEVGDFYFFPNYLMHTVFPFSGTDEERRSVSFNAYIDAKIYDVYGSKK